MDKLLNEFVSTFGTSGDEEFIKSIVLEQLKDKEYEIKQDNLGNLIVKVGNGSEKVMICAHMDQIGFMVSEIEDKGFIKIEKIGEFNGENVSNSYVRFKSGLIGKIVLIEKQLYIDVGINSKEKVGNKVKIGDIACLIAPCLQISNNIIMSPNLDNRVGCYILTTLLKKLEPTKKQLYFVFSSQQLMGNRGAKAAAYTINPDYCIVVDVEESSDYLKGKNDFILGKGPGINVMDKTLIIHEEVKNMFERASKELGVAIQHVVLSSMCEGGDIHKERNGIKTGELCIPCRYRRTSCEMINLNDINDSIELLNKILQY